MGIQCQTEKFTCSSSQIHVPFLQMKFIISNFRMNNILWKFLHRYKYHINFSFRKFHNYYFQTPHVRIIIQNTFYQSNLGLILRQCTPHRVTCKNVIYYYACGDTEFWNRHFSENDDVLMYLSRSNNFEHIPNISNILASVVIIIFICYFSDFIKVSLRYFKETKLSMEASSTTWI